MLSFEDLVSKLRRGIHPVPLKPARKLDQAALLHEAALRLQNEHGGLLAALPLERERFLPWGLRLASLLEELLRQGLEPGDLRHLEGEVIDWAAALLEHLDAFQRAYVDALTERGWTTPGLDCRLVMQRLDEALDAAPPRGLGVREVVCAGFYALSGAEESIFRALWERDRLHVFWHSDPQLARGGIAHPCTVEHANWLRNWGADAVLHAEAPSVQEPRVSFVEGFDLHSQLAALRSELDRAPDATDTAVVLPDEGALLPVLHHLPENKDVNVSMGYPLERTALYQLMESVLRCRENRDDQGRFYWRDLLELVRHPYLKMLRAHGPDSATHAEGDAPALRPVLHWLEQAIRSGDPMQDPAQWIPPYGKDGLNGLDGADADAVEALRRELFEICLTRFGEARTLAGLARALQGLAELLLRAGSHLWKAYVTDAEYLARLLTSIIPQLMDTALSREELGRGTLFALFRQLCRAERVSFEAEPLTGLQVMGVLETRLLRFRRLFVLDAVEERLPGTQSLDPLLPDPLRHLAGLPDARERDNVSAYNFHRLVMGASEAVLLYQSGVQPGALEGKSVRSRYVEQLLWEQEKALGKLVKPGEEPLAAVHFRCDPVPQGLRSIARTELLNARLGALLDENGLTPSQLERYLECPKRFYYQFLARLRPLEVMEEDGDRAEFGSVVHDCLRDFLAPHIGTDLLPEALDAAELTRQFEERLQRSEFYPRMPLDARRALLEAGRMRLRGFLNAQPPTRILELERAAEGRIELDGRSVRLHGRLDRVDRRAEGVVILDYKTGNVSRPRQGFWDDEPLWTRLESPDPDDHSLLTDLHDAARGLQLPAYLRMYLHDRGEMPHDAAWVRLATDGKEYGLFPNKWTPEERIEVIRDRCGVLLRAVAEHLLGCARFSPQPGRQCEYCDYRGPCGK